MPQHDKRPRILRAAPRAIAVIGDQCSGWRCVRGPASSDTRRVPFRFELQDDVHGCLLCCTSTDGQLYGDTWHADLDEALEAANREFGIDTGEWEAGA